MDRSKVPLLSGGSEKRAPEGKIVASKRHSPVEVMCGNSLKMGQNPNRRFSPQSSCVSRSLDTNPKRCQIERTTAGFCCQGVSSHVWRGRAVAAPTLSASGCVASSARSGAFSPSIHELQALLMLVRSLIEVQDGFTVFPAYARKHRSGSLSHWSGSSGARLSGIQR